MFTSLKIERMYLTKRWIRQNSAKWSNGECATVFLSIFMIIMKEFFSLFNRPLQGIIENNSNLLSLGVERTKTRNRIQHGILSDFM